MNEYDGFEISTFIVNTPSMCSYNMSFDEIEEAEARIFNELTSLGVVEIGHYAEFYVSVERIYDMSMEKQYQLVVEGLKRILKL